MTVPSHRGTTHCPRSPPGPPAVQTWDNEKAKDFSLTSIFPIIQRGRCELELQKAHISSVRTYIFIAACFQKFECMSDREKETGNGTDRLSQLKSRAVRTVGGCSAPPLKQYADSRSPVIAWATSNCGPQASQTSPLRPEHTGVKIKKQNKK